LLGVLTSTFCKGEKNDGLHDPKERSNINEQYYVSL
jgi:hypothetical protein